MHAQGVMQVLQRDEGDTRRGSVVTALCANLGSEGSLPKMLQDGFLCVFGKEHFMGNLVCVFTFLFFVFSLTNIWELMFTQLEFAFRIYEAELDLVGGEGRHLKIRIRDIWQI